MAKKEHPRITEGPTGPSCNPGHLGATGPTGPDDADLVFASGREPWMTDADYDRFCRRMAGDE